MLLVLLMAASGKSSGATGGPSADRAVDISRLDIRVGKVLSAKRVSVCVLLKVMVVITAISHYSMLMQTPCMWRK